MKSADLNRLGSELKAVCRGNVLGEKWLLAPTRSIGRQWLDAVTRDGCSTLNVRVKTVAGMAFDLASIELARTGVRRMGGIETEMLIGSIFSKLPKTSGGYLAALKRTPGLSEALSRSLLDMRSAGLEAKDLSAESFEVETKGFEIKALLEAWEAALGKEKAVDQAGVYRMAARRLRLDPVAIPMEAVVLMPSDMKSRLGGLALKMWEAIPAERKRILAVDCPCESPRGEPTDARLLGWLRSPTEAPQPVGDKSARIFSAVGEVGEVKEVLRRCMREGIPFDDVEILHTDTAVYVPLIHEICARIDRGDGSGVPATFAEGVPVRYSRPGRALIGLVTWIREGFPQRNVVRMIQEGLLDITLPEDTSFGFTRLGELFRSVPIGFKAEKYLPALDAAIAGLAEKAREAVDGEDGDIARNRARAKENLTGLKAARNAVAGMLKVAGAEGAGRGAIFRAALEFVTSTARSRSRFDEYSRARIANELRELAAGPDGEEDFGVDAFSALMELAGRSHADGQGPKPGCIHVSPVGSGGHSGRGHTFIIGLDDTRFPGSVNQDPLLLDSERKALSPYLATGAVRMAQRLEDFGLLLARLRGSVFLSFCSRSLVDDRHMFAGSAVMSAYRILSGNREGDQKSLLEWLSAPASFAPSDEESAVDSTEWWLWRSCGEEELEDPGRTIDSLFENLKNGRKAIEARKSDVFTEYDGYVPEAGAQCDPYKKDSSALSGSGLEILGKNPLDYFFKHVLRIREPEEFGGDLSIWLDHSRRGFLLHRVFEEFMTEMKRRNRPPESAKDWVLLERILEKNVEKALEEIPAPSEQVFASELGDLKNIAANFLNGESEHCKTSTPEFFEVSLGLMAEGRGSYIDTPEPLEIILAPGKTIRASGRIDRVDRAGGKIDGFAIWDYKTGSAWGFDRADPHRQGRVIQNALYVELLKARFKEIMPQAEVESFGYFFPGLKDWGLRISWPAAELEQGKKTIALLCDLLKAGCFPVSDKPADLRHSGYAALYGGITDACEASERKLSNPLNKALRPFMALRGYEEEGGDER